MTEGDLQATSWLGLLRDQIDLATARRAFETSRIRVRDDVPPGMIFDMSRLDGLGYPLREWDVFIAPDVWGRLLAEVRRLTPGRRGTEPLRNVELWGIPVVFE